MQDVKSLAGELFRTILHRCMAPGEWDRGDCEGKVAAFLETVVDRSRGDYRKELGRLASAGCPEADSFERVKKTIESYPDENRGSVHGVFLAVIGWLQTRVALLLNEQGHLDSVEAAYARGKADGEQAAVGIGRTLEHLGRLCPDDRVAYLKALADEFCRHCGSDAGDGCYCTNDE